MIRKVVVNGRELEVALGGDGTYRADGREGSYSVCEVQPGVWSLLMDGLSYEVSADGVVNGRRHEIEVIDPRSARKRSGGKSLEGRQTLQASMPGKVVRVLVTVGEAVEAGQGILVVEAMKMQNEVKSPKAGVVVSIAVAEGTTVSAGAVLAVVE